MFWTFTPYMHFNSFPDDINHSIHAAAAIASSHLTSPHFLIMSDPVGRKLSSDERKAARSRRVLEKKTAAVGGGSQVVKKAEVIEEEMISKDDC